MKRTLRRVAPLAALGLAAAALTMVTSGGANSAVAPTPVLATGHVTFAPGVTSGQVLVFADPSNATVMMDTSKAALDKPLIASATVASDGSFTLTADPASLPSNTLLPDKSVNVEAIAVSGGQQLPFFFPVTPVVTSAGVQWASISNAGTKTANIEFNMGSGSVMNSKYNPNRWVGANGHRMLPALVKAASHTGTIPVTPLVKSIAASVRAGTLSKRDDAIGCRIVPGDTFNGKPEHFVNVYDNGSADAHVAQSASATHTLGVAVQASGGNWSASGTHSISRSASTKAISKDRQHSWGYWNKVNYQQFADSCTGRVYRSAIQFNDMLSADIDGSVQYQLLGDSCGQKAKGDQWDTTDAEAVTFGAGVDIGPISLSAQTGYATDENVHFKMLVAGAIRGNSTSGIVQSSKVSASSFPC